MKVEGICSEEYNKLTEDLNLRERQEIVASSTITSETLSKLKLSLEDLPQKCQSLLKEAAKLTSAQLDPVSLSLRQSRTISVQLDQDYEILKLKHKNEVLQKKIDRNSKIIQDMKRELRDAKISLETRDPNPSNIEDQIRHIRIKVASYEENCDKAKAKFIKLGVPEGIYPKSLEVLVNQLATLKAEEATLKEKVDDIVLTNQMRAKFASFRTFSRS